MFDRFLHSLCQFILIKKIKLKFKVTATLLITLVWTITCKIFWTFLDLIQREIPNNHIAEMLKALIILSYTFWPYLAQHYINLKIKINSTLAQINMAVINIIYLF